MTVVIYDRLPGWPSGKAVATQQHLPNFSGEYAFYEVPTPFVEDVKDMREKNQYVRDTGLAVICIPNLK